MAQTNNKREIPDPAEFMRQRMGGGPQSGEPGPTGHAQPMSPGVHAKSPIGDKRNPNQNGQATAGSKADTKKGQQTPASKARGSGKHQTKTLPSNGKKAPAMVKGKPAYGMPSMNAVGRHVNQALGKGTTSSRSGILSHFEGFSGNSDK